MKAKDLSKEDLPKRAGSHLRFTVRSSKGISPSTLPPPPFQHETEVRGLEWWLEAHMSLAGGQLCVEQLADDALGRAVSASLETLRDSLYEMYCDAADPRMRDFAHPDAQLGRYVRAVYALCDEIVAAMLEPERSTSKLVHLARALDALAAPAPAFWTDKLAIDTGSPLEPLRRLPRDAAALTSSVDLLARVLQLKG